MEQKLAVFKGKSIRKVIHKNEWWFSITDVITVLTDSKDPSGYLKDMRRRDAELSEGWGQIATPLLLETEGGKQKINCANTEGLFRMFPTPVGMNRRTLQTLAGKGHVPHTRGDEPPFIWPKDIPTTGSKSGCAVLPSGLN
ncbi:MAG: BRO-N domain-containing protein [Syntrophales bacterium]